MESENWVSMVGIWDNDDREVRFLELHNTLNLGGFMKVAWQSASIFLS